jgi:hypothetical protein
LLRGIFYWLPFTPPPSGRLLRSFNPPPRHQVEGVLARRRSRWSGSISPVERAHQSSMPRSQLHGSSFSASALREPGKRFCACHAARHPGDHEESVLPNRTHSGESQGGIVISNQATTALCAHSSRITRCTSICHIQGGGDPGDYQFFNELPKEVPHGYACAYIPNSNNPVRSIQQAAGGVSGMDADKQAWLAKYATRPSHDNTYSAPGAQTVDQISAIFRDQFGILPKRITIGYNKSYPSDYDLIPLPPKYRLLC